MKLAFYVRQIEENYSGEEKHRLLILKKRISKKYPDIKIDILSINKLDLENYTNISNIFHRLLSKKIIKKLFFNRLRINILMFIYNFLLFLNYKLVIKQFFKKNNYDFVFIWSDASFNEELVISHFVKTICVQFTMNASNANEIVRWFKYSRQNAYKKSWFLEKLTKASQYRCFGELYGPHSGNYINHLIMKLF